MKVHIGPYKDDNTDRKEEVYLHDYDTWNMDHTLALIALPMLKQLKDTKHGVPYMDYEDMPEHLQYIRREWDPRAVGDLFNGTGYNDDEFQRQQECWDWIIDEMIYAFDCKANKDEVYMRIKDRDEIEKEQDRISNGLRLFGKYYEALWD